MPRPTAPPGSQGVVPLFRPSSGEPVASKPLNCVSSRKSYRSNLSARPIRSWSTHPRSSFSRSGSAGHSQSVSPSIRDRQARGAPCRARAGVCRSHGSRHARGEVVRMISPGRGWTGCEQSSRFEPRNRLREPGRQPNREIGEAALTFTPEDIVTERPGSWTGSGDCLEIVGHEPARFIRVVHDDPRCRNGAVSLSILPATAKRFDEMNA
jgi:hypothetical protein